jgi:SAM-dependent methyltransferase
METSDEIIRYWESDIILSFAWNEIYIEIEKLARDLTPDSVLDVGCGQSFIGKFFDHYTGLEISIPALKVAVKNNPKKHYLRGDGLHLPFKNSSFDLVICSDVIEHIEDKDRFLEELTRVSKRYILITTPPEGTLIEMFRIIYCRLKGIEYIDTPYEWRMSKKELLHKLKGQGLRITERKYTGFRIPFSKNFGFLKSLEKAMYKSQIIKGYILLILSEKKV